MLHEFKHVLDDPFVASVYGDLATEKHHRLAEAVCEHFAGCFLMPADWIKRDWQNGKRELAVLAKKYGVSETAVRDRLHCLGLSRRQQLRHTDAPMNQKGGSDE